MYKQVTKISFLSSLNIDSMEYQVEVSYFEVWDKGPKIAKEALRSSTK